MRLARDMKQLGKRYLPEEFGPRRTGKNWYRETGGLRRRLAIAATMAHALASLHERGLAYVDLNPGNVMVSDDMSRAETWLIDTDNLTSRSNPDWNILGFPRYIAPERVRRRTPPSTLADAYILAIHVFRLLVLKHPLEGIATDEVDGETAWKQIDRGEFPYVMDPGDQSNQLPVEKLLLEPVPAGDDPADARPRRADLHRRQARPGPAPRGGPVARGPVQRAGQRHRLPGLRLDLLPAREELPGLRGGHRGGPAHHGVPGRRGTAATGAGLARRLPACRRRRSFPATCGAATTSPTRW